MPEEEVNVYWHNHSVPRAMHEELSGHKGCVVWLTGLSASGKSTIANALSYELYKEQIHVVVLDGDNIRHGLNAGLGFSLEDRAENIRRVGCVAKLFCESGIITITAFISPYRVDRDRVRDSLEPEDFIEVFVNTPLAVCEERDPKGLYQKARAGEVKGFTGIDDPYESPKSPELVLDGELSVQQLVGSVMDHLREARKIKPLHSDEKHFCPFCRRFDCLGGCLR